MRLKGGVAALTLAGCALAAAGGAYLAGGRLALDGLLYDWALAARATLAGDAESGAEEPVAVVALDVRSLESPELAPYPRALFGPVWGQLIDTLGAANARVIAFDFLLSFNANRFQRGYERDFLQALARHRERVVLGRSARTLPARPFLGALRFDEGAVGLLEMSSDEDGVYRRATMHFRLQAGNETLPGLAAAALARAGIIPRSEETILAPRRHLENIPTYALIDVLRCGDKAPETLVQSFGGRLVFVGTSRAEEDRRLPASRFLAPASRPAPAEGACPPPRLGASVPRARTVPGVYLHAAAAEAELLGAFTVPAAMPWRLATAALAGLAGAALGLALAPLAAVALAVAAGLGLWLGEAALIGQQLWLPAGPGMAALAGALFVAYVVRYLLEERRRRRVQYAFGHYLAPAVVDRLLESPEALRLGGEDREVSIMFADLSGFTALSTRISAEQLVHATNAYLAPIVAEVDATGGYVDKFIGDAVMAVWGAPARDDEHALHAVRAALAASARIRALREAAEARGEHGFGVKIGIHSGPAVVGNVGAENRVNYTAVGETVNLASRFEGLPGLFQCDIVVGPATAAAVAEHVLLRELDRVAVKGHETGLAVHQPLAERDAAGEAERALAARYAEALALYRARRFAEARDIWLTLAGDGPSAVMAARAQGFFDDPPPADWDGTLVLTTK